MNDCTKLYAAPGGKAWRIALYFLPPGSTRKKDWPAMTRFCALLVLVFCCASALYGDPIEDAKRAERFHDRLQTIGTGSATSISAFLRDGESLKGTIDYLNESEVGIRDEFGHLRPVPLKGIVDFTAHNQNTRVKTASTNRWRRAARVMWRHVYGPGFDGFMPPDDALALL